MPRDGRQSRGNARRPLETGDFRIRDIDLAEYLGYERPRNIRKLIERLHKEYELVDLSMRPTVGRIEKNRGFVKGVEHRSVIEYHLGHGDAVRVTMSRHGNRCGGHNG